MSSYCVTLFDTIENPGENDACFLAVTKDLTLNKGSSYRIQFLLSKDNNDVNLTGYALSGTIKKSSSSNDILLHMNSANLLLGINFDSSSISMFLPESFTKNIVENFLVYEIYLINPSSETSKIVQGLIKFV